MEFVRTLAHPQNADPPCAGAWALEVDPGQELSVIVLDDPRGVEQGLSTTTLYLWYGVPLTAGRDEALSYIPAGERVELARYRDKADSLAIAAVRAVARVQLGLILNCPPAEVGLVRSAKGKPRVDPARHGDMASRLHFSLSHTRELVAVSLSGAATGIDVETMRPLPDLERLARVAFAPEVACLIAAAQGEARMALFYRLWVLGEAFVKATGQGVSQGVGSFAFAFDGPPRLARVSWPWGPPERWRFGTWPERE